ESWEWVSIGINNRLLSVYFVSETTGWVTGVNGLILKTTDGGITWQAQESGTMEELWAIKFVSAETGWASGTGGVILKTTDGGDTWVKQESGVITELSNIQFISSEEGWLSGENGTVLRTKDGGQTWQKETVPTTEWISSMHFTDARHGCITTTFGEIYLYKDTTTLIKDILSEFDALKIWPNPTTEYIFLDTSGKTDQGCYAIWDQAGRLYLSGMINGEQTRVNTQSLASGLYMVKVIDQKGKIRGTGRFVKMN
ncbi:MAG TPA: YCF48-related protein, partial [Saprospiraceae bacterium]|nr:YCF48-related protein [Saprospiraceae bacterium]